MLRWWLGLNHNRLKHLDYTYLAYIICMIKTFRMSIVVFLSMLCFKAKRHYSKSIFINFLSITRKVQNKDIYVSEKEKEPRYKTSGTAVPEFSDHVLLSTILTTDTFGHNCITQNWQSKMSQQGITFYLLNSFFPCF